MQHLQTGSMKSPGGPRGYPIVGVMVDFPRDRRGFLTDVARQYGDVARFSIANLNFYAVVHPDGVKHVLQDNHQNYERGKMFDPHLQFDRQRSAWHGLGNLTGAVGTRYPGPAFPSRTASRCQCRDSF